MSRTQGVGVTPRLLLVGSGRWLRLSAGGGRRVFTPERDAWRRGPYDISSRVVTREEHLVGLGDWELMTRGQG